MKVYCTCHKENRLDGQDLTIDALRTGDHIIRPLDCGCLGYIHCCFHHAILEKVIVGSEEDQRSVPSFQNQRSIQYPTSKRGQEEQQHQESLEGSANFVFLGFHSSESSDEKVKTTSSLTNCCKRCKAEYIQYTETLNFKTLDVYRLEYTDPRYEGETVFNNAEDLKQSYNSYHVYFNNCEHMSRSCVTGEGTSLQVEAFNNCFAHLCYGWLLRLIKLSLVLCANFLDDFEEHADEIVGVEICATFIYLCMIVKDAFKSWYMRHSKRMCKACFWTNIRKFVCRFFVVFLSVVGIVLHHTVHALNQKEMCKLRLTISAVPLLYLFLIEVLIMCSERCRRNFGRVLCCTCCCYRGFNRCYNRHSDCKKSCYKCCISCFCRDRND